jgi:hypothetical protein
MGDAWFESRGVAPGAGLELSGLAVCVTGRAILATTYKGHPVSVHRMTADELEARDRRVRDVLCSILDENAGQPARPVALIRAWLDREDHDEAAIARRRVAALAVPRLPEPIRSSMRRRTT